MFDHTPSPGPALLDEQKNEHHTLLGLRQPMNTSFMDSVKLNFRWSEEATLEARLSLRLLTSAMLRRRTCSLLRRASAISASLGWYVLAAPPVCAAHMSAGRSLQSRGTSITYQYLCDWHFEPVQSQGRGNHAAVVLFPRRRIVVPTCSRPRCSLHPRCQY